jgi:DNA-binding winged helix-turn-helix (wHTH) protein
MVQMNSEEHQQLSLADIEAIFGEPVASTAYGLLLQILKLPELHRVHTMAVLHLAIVEAQQRVRNNEAPPAIVQIPDFNNNSSFKDNLGDNNEFLITKTDGNTFQIPEIDFVLKENYISIYGQRIQLSPQGLKMIYYFFNNPNQALSKEQLFRVIYPNKKYLEPSSDVDTQVPIRRLRDKLDVVVSAIRINRPDLEVVPYITTVHGVGYKFTAITLTEHEAFQAKGEAIRNSR